MIPLDAQVRMPSAYLVVNCDRAWKEMIRCDGDEEAGEGLLRARR